MFFPNGGKDLNRGWLSKKKGGVYLSYDLGEVRWDLSLFAELLSGPGDTKNNPGKPCHSCRIPGRPALECR